MSEEELYREVGEIVLSYTRDLSAPISGFQLQSILAEILKLLLTKGLVVMKDA